MQRWRLLPDAGTLMVSTDLHGNGDDFRRLCRHFRELRRDGGPVYWALLGDAVHGPDDAARARNPALFDYADESAAIVGDILALMDEHPGEVLYLLGNHDHAHVGGPRTRRFHPDEAAHLESTAGPAGAEAIRRLAAAALLAVAAPCGVLLAHGSPDDRLLSLDDLDAISLNHADNDDYQSHVLDSILNSYGQPGEVTGRLLGRLSSPKLRLSLVIHGHDRDEAGYFTEGGNQTCPVLFGAARQQKRFLLLDLAARYPDAVSLREGAEVRRVHC